MCVDTVRVQGSRNKCRPHQNYAELMLRPQCQLDYNQFPGYQWICLPKTVFISLYQSIAYYYILDLACLGLIVEQCMRWIVITMSHTCWGQPSCWVIILTSPTTFCLSSSGRTYPSVTSFALRGSGSREWSPRGPFHPRGCQDCSWEWSGLMVLGSTVKQRLTSAQLECRRCKHVSCWNLTFLTQWAANKGLPGQQDAEQGCRFPHQMWLAGSQTGRPTTMTE